MSVVLASLWVSAYFSKKERAQEMAEFANEFELQPWPDDALPLSLTFDGTDLSAWSSLWDIYVGKINGIETVVCDCRIGHGKGSWTRTVIAARARRSPFGAEAFDPDLHLERQGEWFLLYRPRQMVSFGRSLMTISELRGQVLSISLVETERFL